MSSSTRARAAVLCAVLSALTVVGMAGATIASGDAAPSTSARVCATFPSQTFAQAALTHGPRLDGEGIACGRHFGAVTPSGGVVTAAAPTP